MTISPIRSHLPRKNHFASKHHLPHKDHFSCHDHLRCNDHLLHKKLCPLQRPLNDHFPFNGYYLSKTISL